MNFIISKNEFLRNWFISDVIETPFFGKPAPTEFKNYHPGAETKDENGKEIRSPAKLEYIKTGKFKKSEYPSDMKIEKLYCPFDTTRVDQSEFWTFPTEITFYARAYINAENTHEHPFCLYACGAVKIWVNGELQTEFYPFSSNIEQSTNILLTLKNQSNEIVVGCNDYGERNIVFKFGLQNIGNDINLTLPINADIEKMNGIDNTFRSMYLDKLSYSTGSIKVCFCTPFVQDMALTIKTSGITKNIAVKKGKTDFIVADVSELPIGFHTFKIFTDINGVQLSATLMAECYAQKFEIADINDCQLRKKAVLDFAVNNTPLSLERYIAWLALGENKYEEHKAVIDETLLHVQRRGDCSDFRTLKFFWLLKKYRNLLSTELIDCFENALLQFRYWFDENGNDAMWFFSENHALCFHVSEMLAGEMFEDKIFTNSGLTGRQHAAKAKLLIIEWFEKLLCYGYNEWNSAAYITVDMLSYITLFTFCQDHELCTLAKKALDFTYEIFAENSFKGVLGTSNGRTYPRDLLANKCLSSNGQIWLAWGCGCLNQHIDPVVYLALSEYNAPKHLLDIAVGNKPQRLVYNKPQGTKNVPTVVCKTNSYILGTCVSPRTGFLGSQEHLLNIFLQDANTRIWINHPGEGKIWGQKRPGYMTGNGLTPLVSQFENIAVMSYCFPENLLKCAEVNFTHAMCDLALTDKFVVENNWAFIKKGQAFAALYAVNGISVNHTAPLNEKELISNGINNTWFVKVSCLFEIDSFDAFINVMKKNQPIIKNNELFYHDFELGDLKFNLLKEDYLRKVTP